MGQMSNELEGARAMVVNLELLSSRADGALTSTRNDSPFSPGRHFLRVRVMVYLSVPVIRI
jgi:hypothetical protein